MSRNRNDFAGSRNPVEKTLSEIWAQILGLEQVGVCDDFFQLGGDSLSAAELFDQIQKVFGQTLPITILMQGPTVECVARVISRQNGLPSRSSLVELQPQGSKPPFFCIHGVGGEVLCFMNLARHMAPDQPFYGISAASSGRVVESVLHVEDMAAHYIEEIRTVQPEGPYFLGGYSFGGSVALEIAQQLDAQGQKVALLAILDHTPPPIRYHTALWRPAFFIEFLRNIPYWIIDDIFNSEFDEILNRIRLNARNAKRRINNLLGHPDPEYPESSITEVADSFDLSRIPEQFRKLLEVNYRALRDYVPKVYPGRVTLFRARTRPLLRLHGYDLGWSKLAGGGLEIIAIPGNHNSILIEPHVKILAKRLRACLEKAQTTNKQWFRDYSKVTGQLGLDSRNQSPEIRGLKQGNRANS